MADQTAALFDKLDGFYLTKSEHDWLERRFANMTEKEKILFQGAMELEKPQEIGHVTRIASSWTAMTSSMAREMRPRLGNLSWRMWSLPRRPPGHS